MLLLTQWIAKTRWTFVFHFLDPEPTNITCADGNVRLRNGAAANEGRVEICYNNQWGPVCDQAWNYRKAMVTCRQLGLVPYGNVNSGIISNNGQGREGGQKGVIRGLVTPSVSIHVHAKTKTQL